MSKKKLILVYLFVIIIIIDFIFLIYLFYNSNTSYILTLKNSLPLIRKDFFIDDLNLLSLNYQSVVITKGSSVIPITGTALFKGYIDGEVFFDKKNSFYILPIKLVRSNKFIKTNLMLNQKINIRFAKKGLITEGQLWNYVSVKDVIKHFKNKHPLIIKINFDQKIYDVLRDQENCNDKCKLVLDEYKIYSKNAEKIFSTNLKTHQANKILTIGPATSLIIYVN